MSEREEFEKWVGNTSWTLYQKSIMFLAWQEQQKKIDERKALNPDVQCPVCEGKRVIFNLRCGFCKDGRVPLTKAQEYKLNHYYTSAATSVIKELEAGIERLEELLQLHRENDKIAGAME